MNKKLVLMILAVMFAFIAKGAWADGPFPTAMTDGTFGPVGQVTPSDLTSAKGEPELYNAVNLLLGTSYTNNTQLNSMQYTGGSNAWDQTGGGAFTLIGLGAGNTNTLEVYNTATPGTLISPLGTGFSGNSLMGNGSSSNPYFGTTAVLPLSTQFGFAINSNYGYGSNTWYSNAALNSDGYDHMLTYNLSSLTGDQIWILDPNTNTEQLITLQDPYLLGFEDTSEVNNGATDDMDYNDLMFLVNGVSPATSTVPEPMTMALFGVGILAMAGYAFRQNRPLMMA